VSWDSLRDIEFDILVNATSVGMVPHVNESPVPKAILKKKIVFDAVYNPPMTKLLRDAEAAGSRVIHGTEMYLNQAALQSAMYTGRKPKLALMRKLIQSSS
jgi:shikimate 5-dehydrogenase